MDTLVFVHEIFYHLQVICPLLIDFLFCTLQNGDGTSPGQSHAMSGNHLHHNLVLAPVPVRPIPTVTGTFVPAAEADIHEVFRSSKRHLALSDSGEIWRVATIDVLL